MKNIVLVTLTAAILAACASNAPTPTQAQSLNVGADQALSQIQQRETRTIAYYNADGQLMEQATAGGFYRNLLGRTKEGHAVVQDFYQDSQSKQTNAVLIPDEANLTNFNVEVTEGRTIWYAPSGEVTQFADVKQGQIINLGHYLNGRLAHEEVQLTDTKGHRITAYYDNGKTMLISTQNSPAADVAHQFYDRDGKLILDTNKTPLPQEGEANYAVVQSIFEQYAKLLEHIHQH